MKDNIGNRFEHSVLASHYLKQCGIDSYIAQTDFYTNRAFVLIGSPPGLDRQTAHVTRLAPGAIAHACAVVCDARYHEWFSVQQDWGRRIWRIFESTTKVQPAVNRVELTFFSQAHITR